MLAEIVKTEAGPAQENCQTETLNKFMNTLSEIDASILMMYLYCLSSDEIASVVGISDNAVSIRINSRWWHCR